MSCCGQGKRKSKPSKTTVVAAQSSVKTSKNSSAMKIANQVTQQQAQKLAKFNNYQNRYM